jgi:catechol 2,3-dioxygenase-like lactoylglutathione lyase family enzyme
MLKKVRHIGIIVEDFDRAVKKFEGFGLACNEVIEREKDGMRIGFFPIGDTLIEFLRFSPDKGWDAMHKVVRSQKGPINQTELSWQRAAPGQEPTAGWPFLNPKRRKGSSSNSVRYKWGNSSMIQE